MGQNMPKPPGAGKPEKWEPPVAPEIGKRKKKRGPDAATRIPKVYPNRACLLRKYRLERCKDYLLLEEEFLRTINAQRDAQSNLEEGAMGHYEAELKRVEDIRGTPLEVATLEEAVDDSHAIVSISGTEYYVPLMSFVDKEQLELGCSVLLHDRQHSIVGVLKDDVDPLVSVMKVDKAPEDTYADIGGLEQQIQEIKEAVEFPLSHPELYDEIGIKPPKGVILYGVPGTGKTLLAKAVANRTDATFIRVIGSELVQRYIGEGARMIREIFQLARTKKACIIFFDEVDAVGGSRGSGDGDDEIQRTMLEMVNQMDGFDSRGNIKVIMATNRPDTLDPALTRPGRMDRKLEIGLPDLEGRTNILRIHSRSLSCEKDVRFELIARLCPNTTGADLRSVCTEAGMFAIRARRKTITEKDFLDSVNKVVKGQHKFSATAKYMVYN